MVHLSNRVNNIAPSATLEMSAKATSLKNKNIDVVDLSIGEPDFFTPQTAQTAAIESIKNGRASHYTPSGGLPELKNAIINRHLVDEGTLYDFNQVVVTTGAKHTLFTLFQVILNPDDEVILPIPYWVSYDEQIKLAEGVTVFVQPSEQKSFKITVSDLERVRTNKTKAIVLNSPSNPSGEIYTEAELINIGNWAVKYNILIIADDIYGKLVYNGHKFIPISSISDTIRNQCFIINGVSKSYAMTGWRIGYGIGHPDIIKGMNKFLSHSTSNATAAAQYGAIGALTGDQSVVEKMRLAFESRLNIIYPKVASLPGFKLTKPQGAFYLFPNIREALDLCHIKTTEEFSNELLSQKHVALTPGGAFGFPDNIRISYASDLNQLESAVNKIAEFIHENTK